MKKTFSLILAVIMLALTLCSCGDDGKTNAVIGRVTSVPPFGSRHITVLGDSIAAGYGLDDQSENYVSIFATNVGATITNDAVSGYDSEDLLLYLQSGKATRDIQSADIIIISVGGNDVLHEKELMVSTLKEAVFHGGDYFTDDIEKIYTEFENNLREIIAFIQTANPSCAIITQTVYNPVLKQGYRISVVNVARLVSKYIDRLNESILSVCDGMPNVCVFDIADRMNDDEKNFYDAQEDFDIHPTAYGHKNLAKLYTDDFNQIVG